MDNRYCSCCFFLYIVFLLILNESNINTFGLAILIPIGLLFRGMASFYTILNFLLLELKRSKMKNTISELTYIFGLIILSLTSFICLFINPLLFVFALSLFYYLDKSFKDKFKEARDGKCTFCRDKSYTYRFMDDLDCDTCNIIYVIKNGNYYLKNGKPSYIYN